MYVYCIVTVFFWLLQESKVELELAGIKGREPSKEEKYLAKRIVCVRHEAAKNADWIGKVAADVAKEAAKVAAKMAQDNFEISLAFLERAVRAEGKIVSYNSFILFKEDEIASVDSRVESLSPSYV